MYNHMRLSGIASGIDTEEMVQNLMQAERIKVDRVEQDKQLLVWRQEAYNSINRDFVNFILNSRKKFGLTSVTSQGSFKPNAYQDLNWIKKATSSNENVATVSTMAKALDGSYNVDVKRLAEGVTMASGSEVTIVDGAGRIVEKGIGDEDDRLVKVLEFQINGKDIQVSNEDGVTMNELVRAINSTEDIGVRASYDAGFKRFFLQTASTGKDAEIVIGAIEGLGNSTGRAFIEGLDLSVNGYVDGDGTGDIRADQFDLDVIYRGRDALVNFNGANDISSSSNHIMINGIEMDLRDEGSFTITIATDVDAVYDKIEEFVNDYNELVDRANKLLGEKQHRDYKPLTGEQRKGMEKADIDLWEEKARSGLLRNDDIIQRTMLNMRRALYEKSEEFSGPFKLLTEMGISTETYSRGSAGGKLLIDEAKLRDAIGKEPEAIMEFLFKESIPDTKDEDGNTIAGELGGIVSRIHNNLMDGIESIIKKSGIGDKEADLFRDVKFNILLDFVTEQGSISLLDKDLLQFNSRIEDLNTILFNKENSYYAKFTAMEKAISRMNQQSMWLMQQFMQ